MKNVAIILLIVGTVVGTVGGAHLPEANWLIAGSGIALLLAGVLVYRLAERQRIARARAVAPGEKERLSPVDRALVCIRELPGLLDPIVEEMHELPLEVICERVGELEDTHFEIVGEAAEALFDRLGGATFAQVFGLYSGGERLVRRAWSAAADHHRPECMESLAEGAERIREAVAALEAQEPALAR